MVVNGKSWSWVVVFFTVTGLTSTDISKDREECAPSLVGLATCLPYAGGQAKNPTSDCCVGIKQVLGNNKKCLCVLVKDRNDPSLGLNINATRALSLPAVCNSPTNISACITLLHLTSHSPEAKVFQDFAKSIKGSNETSSHKSGSSSGSATGSSTPIKSDGGKVMRRLIMEVICGVLLLCFTPYLTFPL